MACVCVVVSNIYVHRSLCPCYLWFINFIWVLQEMKSHTFNARKMFQYAILCVRAMVRIKRLHFTPEPLSMEVAQVDPYRIKVLRKVSSLFTFYMRLNIVIIRYTYSPAETLRFRRAARVIYIILISYAVIFYVLLRTGHHKWFPDPLYQTLPWQYAYQDVISYLTMLMC
jgi:hypothetical protein